MSYIKEYVNNFFSLSGLADADKEIAETAKRHSAFIEEFFDGAVENMTTFPSDSRSWVFVRNVPVYSMCEHHILPFFGVANFAYRPNGKILGLSKFPRLVRRHASMLQNQERLTDAIFYEAKKILETEEIGVFLSCRHLCMEMRGVRTQSETETMRYTDNVLTLGLENLRVKR